jgi:hypothetical protein
MTRKEKWKRYEELHAKAAAVHVEWRALCDQINALIMAPTTDQTKRRRER